MKFKFSSLLLSLFLILNFGCEKSPQNGDRKPLVLVSIAPYKYFIQKIAGDQFDVMSIVPEGVDSHTYEPSPKEISKMQDALIWFQMGETFERKLSRTLELHNKNIDIQNLNELVELISGSSGDHLGHHHDFDIHTWLNPSIVGEQSEVIAQAFANHFPGKTSEYRKNFHALLDELSNLDLEIRSILKPLKYRTFLTSHPSFGYFCQEYSLKQLSIESEGKDPLPRDLMETVKLAKETKVKVVLLQPQFSSKGALKVAGELKLPTKIVDPYSVEYQKNLLRLTRILRDPKSS